MSQKSALSQAAPICLTGPNVGHSSSSAPVLTECDRQFDSAQTAHRPAAGIAAD